MYGAFKFKTDTFGKNTKVIGMYNELDEHNVRLTTEPKHLNLPHLWLRASKQLKLL